MKASNKVPKAQRSLKQLTFDQVARSHHETTYDEIAFRYGGPMSKHPVISVKGHPEVIWVRPDMTVGMVANSISIAMGSPPCQIPWREAKLSLKDGYLPIVISTWYQAPLLYTQTSFACLLGARTVRNGHEKQVAMVEMKIENTGATETRNENLWAFVNSGVPVKGVPPFPYNTYDLFEVVGSLPPVQDNPAEPEDIVLRDGSRSLGIYSTDSSVKALSYNNVLRFAVDLRPGETQKIHWTITSSARGLTPGELEQLREMGFYSELEKRVHDLEAILGKGTQVRVPETAVTNIFKAQILHTQSQILQAADEDYCLPVQGFQGVWPWEAMKLTTHLDSIGHHEDARKCLTCFLKIQGKFPPHGHCKSNEGVFGGTISFEESGWQKDPQSTLYGQLARLNASKQGEFPNWMNGTGAMLYAFGTHYRYTRDRDWMQRVAPALIRACDWIVTERQETKIKDEQGERVLHYGLLPMGRAYDTAEEVIRKLKSSGELAEGKTDDRHAPLDTYYPCFTDGYSSQGLSCLAEALAEIDHLEAGRLVEEAKAYRDDILEVMRRSRTAGPDQPPYPERLNRPPAWAEFATGALSYWDSGFLEPRSEAFEQFENYMKKKWNREVLGLTGGLDQNGDQYRSNAFYVNFSEDIWHRNWLLRGEIEKALLTFYSMLAYGMDKQTYVTVERFHLTDERYAPFFMDTSAGARVCGLVRQALLLEQGSSLYLLAGAPRRWLEAGKEIEVIQGVTTLAKIDFKIESEVNQGKVLIAISIKDLHAGKLETLRLRLPHPTRKKINRVVVNGEPWGRFNQEEEVINLTPESGRTDIVAMY